MSPKRDGNWLFCAAFLLPCYIFVMWLDRKSQRRVVAAVRDILRAELSARDAMMTERIVRYTRSPEDEESDASSETGWLR